MTNDELHKAVHPEVIERIEALFERSMVLADAAEGLIKEELTQAASQVTYKLVAEMKTFRSELAGIKAKAEEHFKSTVAAVKAATEANLQGFVGQASNQATAQNVASVCTAAEEAGATPLDSGITADPA